MQALRFRSSVQADVVDGKRLFLLNDVNRLIIDNPVTARVAELIDGSRGPSDIVAALSTDFAPMRVFQELTRLQRAGLVLTTPALGSPTQAYVEAWGPSTDGYAAQAAQTSVVVCDLTGSAAGGLVVDAVDRLGPVARRIDADVLLDHAAHEEAAVALWVIVAEDYLDARLREFNAQAHRRGQQWLLAKPWGREVWVGPRFVPGETGCWECLAERAGANRQVERYVSGKLGRPLPTVKPSGLLPGAEGIVAGMVASEVFAVTAGRPGSFAGVLRTVDLETLDSVQHRLVDQPQCPVSGDPGQQTRPTAQVRLQARPAMHRHDGGYRVCSPAETFARLEHQVGPILGAVSRLDPLDGNADGVTYSYVAGHNFGMVQDNMELLRSNMRGQSGGKGRTQIQAKTSAVCEALERYCGVWNPSVPAVRAAYQDLTGPAVHPRDYLLLSDRQYAGRREWNADPRNRLHRVPEPFDPTVEMDFTPAWSLTHDHEVLVPAGLVWFGHPDLDEHFYAVTDSNGGAAGNTVEEAVLQALCEVYERDAVALWWYNRCPRPGVDLDSFQDGYVQVMRDYYATLGRDIWVLDLSNDLGVSTFAAVSRRNHEVQDLMIGFGAHPDPDIALFRSLTELNQFLPFVNRRDSDGNTIYGTDDAATVEWCRNATVQSEPWVLPNPALPTTRREDLDRAFPTDLGELVRWCVEDLAAAGVETVVVNQSRPDIELSVVKVLAPGMRHFWQRMAPGRLYDVPVRLGWLAEPTPQERLNPRGVFF
jgi:ribosomal protein S12 methylthiotransferase accessory factor